MKAKIISAVFAVITLLAGQAGAQTYDTNNDTVQTFAGYGIPGYVDGQGQLTAFSNPTQIVSDTASNLYVWDNNNARIRKITPAGTVTTFAGGGSYLEGYGTNVSLSGGSPGAIGAMAIDHANTLWLVLTSSGYYYGYNNQTLLLTIETNGYVSIANGGLTNLTTSSGLCFDSANNLYYSGGNRIYRYNSGNETSQAIAGSGISGYFNGPGTFFSAFSNPTVLACDQANNIYVWDSGNAVIRRIDPMQNVTTFAGSANGYYYSNADGVGTNAAFYGINSMFFDHQGNLYVVSSGCVRKIDAQTNVVTLAGNFSTYQYSPSYADGPGNLARFNNATGGCFSQGMIFVADSGNNRIRDITFNQPPQVVSPASLQLNSYPGLQITGTIGRTYQIQSSPNMSAWNPVATVLLNASPYLWIDQNPVSGNKYYRAVQLP